MSANTAVAAVVLSFFTASVFKLAAIAWLGGTRLLRATWVAILTPVAAAGAGMWLSIGA